MQARIFSGSRLAWVMAAALVLAVGQVHAANIVIDSFETAFDVTGEGGWNGIAGNSVGPRSNVTTLTQTGIAGAIGDRTTTFTGDNAGNNTAIVTGLTIDTSGTVTASAGEGVLTVNTNAGSIAFNLEISYAVTNLDLSAGDRFLFNFSGDLDDRVIPATLPFDIELTSGATTDIAGVTLSADGGPYEILFSAFTGINFSDIDGIRLLSSDGVSSPDFLISAIEVQVVPIPAAVWLFGSALGLLGWMRRRTTQGKTS